MREWLIRVLGVRPESTVQLPLRKLFTELRGGLNAGWRGLVVSRRAIDSAIRELQKLSRSEDIDLEGLLMILDDALNTVDGCTANVGQVRHELEQQAFGLLPEIASVNVPDVELE